MRKPIIAGNWKMNKTRAQTAQLIDELKPLVKSATCDVVVCVPYTDLDVAKQHVEGSNIKLGAQNVAWADSGAFTGEISAEMLKEIGVEYVIIGHSERRQMFGETDETVSKRVDQALANSLKVIMCCGESEAQREAGLTDQVNRTQILGGLQNVTAEQMADVVIAYEPIWAIGTGKTATSEDANKAIAYIRSVLCEKFGAEVANGVRIQYGGSMKPTNCEELMSMSDIDGGLIGGASLKANDFAVIVASGK